VLAKEFDSARVKYDVYSAEYEAIKVLLLLRLLILV
jgi:hypothetical protein